MGVYNCEKYVGEAIRSILNQDYKNLEFLIIDDCSTDNTPSILSNYSEKDSRIKILRNDKNRGLGYSLALGMNQAKGEYIARMDADDISSFNRISTQVKYLIKNPDIVCVGTSAKRFGDISIVGKIFGTIHSKTKHEQIKAWLLIGTPMFHPSVMFNNRLMRSLGLNYNSNYRRAQDYELWTRLVFKAKMANIDRPLHYYRYHREMASNVSSSEQRHKARDLHVRMLKQLIGRSPTEIELYYHQLFAFGQNLNMEDLRNVDSWLQFLYDNSTISKCYDPASVKEMISTRRVVVIRTSIKSRIKRIKYYYSRSLLSRFSIRIFLMLLR